MWKEQHDHFYSAGQKSYTFISWMSCGPLGEGVLTLNMVEYEIITIMQNPYMGMLTY